MNRWVPGLIILSLGIVGLLNNFNLIEYSIGSFIAHFWPLLLIIWGISFIFEGPRGGNTITGLIIAGLGVIFLGKNFQLFYVDFSWLWKAFWPLLIILVGLSLLIGKRGSRQKSVFMGGLQQESAAWRLESGTYQAMMGEVKLDLRVAEIPSQVTHVNLKAVMGAVKVIVPSGLVVICEGSVVFGELKLLGKQAAGIVSSLKAQKGEITNNQRVVYLHCQAVFGAVEVIAV